MGTMIRPRSDDRFDPFSANDRAWPASLRLILLRPPAGRERFSTPLFDTPKARRRFAIAPGRSSLNLTGAC
jgi:hypothetical protein